MASLGGTTPNGVSRTPAKLAATRYVILLSTLTSARSDLYQLKDEPALRFSRLVCIDGNSSLKCSILFGGHKVGDTRVLTDSSYFIPAEYVDKFAREVRGRQAKGPAVKPKGPADDSNDDNKDNWFNVDDIDVEDPDASPEEGDPTDGLRLAVKEAAQHSTAVPLTTTLPPAALAPGPVLPSRATAQAASPPSGTALPPSGATSNNSPDARKAAAWIKILAQCVKNWKAASADEQKKMWKIFEETEIFVAACCHGFMLWIVDMVRSGEL